MRLSVCAPLKWHFEPWLPLSGSSSSPGRAEKATQIEGRGDGGVADSMTAIYSAYTCLSDFDQCGAQTQLKARARHTWACCHLPAALNKQVKIPLNKNCLVIEQII